MKVTLQELERAFYTEGLDSVAKIIGDLDNKTREYPNRLESLIVEIPTMPHVNKDNNAN